MTELMDKTLTSNRRLAEREAENCSRCNGVDSITCCPNLMRGYMAIYRDNEPLAYRECEYGKRLRLQHRQKAMMGAANLGERFWSRTFDRFTVKDFNRRAYESARNYASTFIQSRRWLILSGPVGVGKTHLAVAVLLDAIGRNLEPLYCPVVDMLARHRASFQTEDTMDYDTRLRDNDLLVLDDLGKERDDEKAKEFLFGIINGRYEGDMPTIITTNLDGEGIKRRYGMPILSRLSEVGEIVVMTGSDWRLAAM